MPIKSEFAPVAVADEPFPPRLLSAIWQHFAMDPTKMALINARHPEGDNVTFGELYAFSLATTAFLAAHGFGRGDVACLALPNCWEYVAIFIGAGLQGGAISGANPMFTEEEFGRQFADCRCKIVFCTRANFECILRAVKKPLKNVELIVLVESGHSKGPLGENDNLPLGIVRFGQVLRTKPNVGAAQFPVLKHCRPERDVLLLPYSSGTTGPPKGVMLSHRNVGTMQNIAIQHYAQHVYGQIHGLPAKWNELLFLPFFHVYGFGNLIACLLIGRTGLVMARFEQDLFCRTVQEFKIPALKVVPPILVFLAKSPKLEQYDFSHVRLIVTGAAPVGADLCQELHRRFPRLEHVAQGFGMTEVTIATHYPVLDGGKQRHSAVGKLAANLEMKILDLETGTEVEQGMPGELHVRGPTVMLGYLGRPEETAKMIDADGWLRTGDVVFLDRDGFIHVVDRHKELIKVNGLQVSPSELEDLLLAHPDIQDCAVVGVPDPAAGELPRAFVVPRNGSTLSREAVRQFVKAKAVYYKQLKGGVEFVDAIPKSPAGKILRRFLRDRVRSEKQSKI